jgi:1-acyl-sn-glycerol-3-phosphate acyltransferase
MVMTLLALVLGTIALLIGLVYPSRRVIAFAAVVWSRAILSLAGVRLTIVGKELVADRVPRFFMGNHQSALDIPILLLALDGHVRFMAKDTLFRIPVFGWVLMRYGYAPINRSSPRVTLRTIERMLERLRRTPISIAVFPEGTRSSDGQLLTFRRGTMKVGQRSGLPIVPFSIEGSLAVYSRDRFAAHPGPVKLIFAESIPAEEVATMSTLELHDRVKATIARLLGQTHEPEPVPAPGLMAAEVS